jgi:ADP-ribose pyrophosphatase YjhB (NUDIX family)
MSEQERPVLVWLLFEQDDNVLIARRKVDAPPFAGQWTLPGEELERGKSPSDLIAEFAHDQLDVQIMGDEPFQTLHANDGAQEYAVAVHRVGFEGRPRFRESGPYTEVGWAPRGDLMDGTAYPALVELAGYLTGTVR